MLIPKANILFLVHFLLFFRGCSEKTEYAVLPCTKSRVVILTDMLNEADDSQTMVRLLMYANRMDIEGLIAVSSCHQYLGKNDPDPLRNGVHPEEIRKFIASYALVVENLKQHEDGWPDPEYLYERVGAGPPEFGMLGVGEGHSSSGSQLIARALLNDLDPRPVYVCINAGANCLAQTLFDLRDSLEENRFLEVTEKLRIYDDAGQDNAGAWIAQQFPHISYQRSSSQVFNFYNTAGPVTWDTAYDPGEGQHRWASEHVQNNHGPLGEKYPIRYRWLSPGEYHTLEGGGTSTWIGHVNHGLYVPEEKTWGGWGGRFKKKKVQNLTANGQLKWAGLEGTEEPYKDFYMYPEARDQWLDPISDSLFHEIGTPIYRWRSAYQNDFEARMDWCVKSYQEANHNPVAVVFNDFSDGILIYKLEADSKLELDASMSIDPDQDGLNYRWYIYPEAGSYKGEVNIEHASTAKTVVRIPPDATGKSIHLILEVQDKSSIVPLYDYRRIIFQVKSN